MAATVTRAAAMAGGANSNGVPLATGVRGLGTARPACPPTRLGSDEREDSTRPGLVSLRRLFGGRQPPQSACQRAARWFDALDFDRRLDGNFRKRDFVDRVRHVALQELFDVVLLQHFDRGRRGRNLAVGAPLGRPLRQLRGIPCQRERAIVVFDLRGRLRSPPQPDDGVNPLISLPERICGLQCPGHIFGIGVERRRNAGHGSW